MWYTVQGKPAPERKHKSPIFYNDIRSINVGLMGGSFNPAHEGHLFVAKTSLKILNLDELWWIVSPQNPLKNYTELNSLNKRIEHTKKIALHPKFKVLSLESIFKTNCTFDFLRKLLPRCPNMKFIWIMGADNLYQFDKWKNPKQIVKLLPIAVFSRPSYSYKSLYSKGAQILGKKISNYQLCNLVNLKPPKWGFIDEGRYNISSSKIRIINKMNMSS